MSMPMATLRLLLECNSLQSDLSVSIFNRFHDEVDGRTEMFGNGSTFHRLFPRERIPDLIKQVKDMPEIQPGLTLPVNHLKVDVEHFLRASYVALVQVLFACTRDELSAFWNHRETRKQDVDALKHMLGSRFLTSKAHAEWLPSDIKLSSLLLTPHKEGKTAFLCTWARDLRNKTVKVRLVQFGPRCFRMLV